MRGGLGASRTGMLGRGNARINLFCGVAHGGCQTRNVRVPLVAALSVAPGSFFGIHSDGDARESQAIERGELPAPGIVRSFDHVA